MLYLFALVATVAACKSKDDCSGLNMTKPHCVEQETGHYSQCIDCEPEAFQLACKSWSADLLKPAQTTCGLKCTGVPPKPPGPEPPKLACHADTDCAKTPATPKCVVQADGQYAQCISCTASAFQRACPYWEPTKFKPAAEKKCDEKCSTPPKPKLACEKDTDCPTARPSCVVQADRNFAECITCEKKQFDYDCVSWDKTKFLPLAEKKCDEKCPSVVEAAPQVEGEQCCGDQCSSDSDCAAGLFCCPNHLECMDTTTKSTIGPNCDACNPPSPPKMEEKKCDSPKVEAA